MKIFKSVKQTFQQLIFLVIICQVQPVKVVFQWIIKHVKQDLKLLMLAVIILYFILLALKQVNEVAIVIILMIPTQKYVFLLS